jgi:hypothetical protein
MIDKARLFKTICKGLAKGILYYIIYYILIIGGIVLYLLPTLLSSSGIKGVDTASIFEYKIVDYGIIAWFITLYILGELIKEYIPFGVLLEAGISIALVYILIIRINYGRVSQYVPQIHSMVYLDASPLVYETFYAFIFLVIGGALIGAAKEYKRRYARHTKRTTVGAAISEN